MTRTEAKAAREAARQHGEKHYVGLPCRRGHDGLRLVSGPQRCVACRKGEGANYYAKSREKHADRHAAYRKANLEKVRERGRAYREANAEKISEKARERYESNPEKVRERARKHYEVNP